MKTEILRGLAALGLTFLPIACKPPEVNQEPQTTPQERLISPSPTATILEPEEIPTPWSIATSTFTSIPTFTITPQPTFTPTPKIEKEVIFTEKVNLAPEEQKMLEAINKIRQENSLSVLEISLPLTQIARVRSEQASRVWGHFLHPTPTPGEKYALLVLLERHQLPYRRAGEILFRTNVKPEEVGSVGISKFLESPPHRDVLLDPRYLEIGIGHTRADEDQLHYFAIILGEP